MFNPKKTLPFLGFLFGLIIIFFLNTNVVAQEKLIAHNLTEGEKEAIVAQQNPDEVQITTIVVRGNVHMLTGDGGNIGLSVGEDGVMMVDSQFSSLSTKIQDAIAKLSTEPIRYLVNTHYHFDHTDGNANFAQAGATIIAHDNVPKQLSVAHEYPVLGMTREAASIESIPPITFSDEMTFAFNDNDIHALHIPLAHTDGDIVIHFMKQNVIHTGDLFFNGFYPFIDTGVGGSVDGMINAIDRILSLCDDDTLIIPGHGNLSNKQELISFQNMLKTVSERVKAGIAKNMTLEEMIEAQTLADLDEQWGKGFLSSEQFLTIAYQGMSK